MHARYITNAQITLDLIGGNERTLLYVFDIIFTIRLPLDFCWI